MTDIIWKVKNMRVNPINGDYHDFICEIDWVAEKQQDGVTAFVEGTMLIEKPPANSEWSFIPYNQVTKEQVVEWVKDRLFKEGVMLPPKMDEQKNYTAARYRPKLEVIEMQLDEIIFEKKNPKIITKPLPW